MEKKQTALINQNNEYDWIPGVLRTASGFNSCITVGLTSLIFVMTIYHSVVETGKDWFDGTQIALMLCGPIVIAWNFTNAKSILATVLSVDDSELKEQEQTEAVPIQEVKIPQGAALITDQDVSLERELFGLSTVMLRAIAGCIAVHVICFVSIIFTLTIRDASITGKTLPGNVEILLAVVGPVITSWTFVRAVNTLSVLMQSKSRLIDFREKLAELIRPKT